MLFLFPQLVADRLLALGRAWVNVVRRRWHGARGLGSNRLGCPVTLPADLENCVGSETVLLALGAVESRIHLDGSGQQLGLH
jgi:hypothetical protein